MKSWDDINRLLLGMKLTVIGGRGAATGEALIRAARKGSLELSRAIADTEETIEGAVVFLTGGQGRVGDANTARDVHVPADSSPAEVLSGIAAAFRGHEAGCAMLVPTGASLDDSWQHLLADNGFTTHRQSLLLMGSLVEPEPNRSESQIVAARAVVGEYAAFLERILLTRGQSRELANGASKCGVGFLDVDSLDVLVARSAGRIVASVGVNTIAEFGILDRLRVEPGASRKAVDTLLWHLLDLCKRSQFRQLIAAVDESDNETLDVLMRIGMKYIETMESYIRPGFELLA